MQRKLVNLFPNSAGVLLLSGALAVLVANLSDSGRVQLRDPVFSISMQNLFWIVSALALIVAMPCLFGRQFGLKTTLVVAGAEWIGVSGRMFWERKSWRLQRLPDRTGADIRHHT
jgi:hypothetical protein